MKSLVIYIAGFASGWAARMTLDSLRGGAVTLVAAAYRVADGARRYVGIEREYLQDLLAEGRARYDMEREAVVAGDADSEPESSNEETRDERRVRAA